jgi:hypothetical protein
VIGRSRHLSDDRLQDCTLAERCGEALDPRAADHLADCPECHARYLDIAAFFDTIARDGACDADEVFTADRLEQQHEAVMRKLELAGRPARVISFPGRVPATAAQASSRMAPRWLAAAAVAGLVVGVGLGGTLLPSRNTAPRTTQAAATRVAPVPARVAAPVPEPAVDDDRFLIDLEIALQRPHTRELLSFDNLTPHVREIGTRVR